MNRIDVKRVQLDEVLSKDESGGAANLQVNQVMTTDPSCISTATTAMDLAQMFHEKKFRHLLVEDVDGRLVGLISDRDLISCFSPINPPTKEQLSSISTTELMSTDLLTVSPEAPVSKAVALMMKHGISCLPVVAERKLQGIVTSTDLQILLQVMLEPSATLQPELHLL